MKRFEKLTVISIAIVLGFLLVLPAQSFAETYTLRGVNGHPSTHIAQKPTHEWAKAIEEQTNGRVKIKIYWGTLGKVFEFYDMIRNGDVDFGQMGTGWSGGRMPMCEIVDLAFESPDVVTGSEILRALYKQGLLKELDEFKVLEIHSMITGNLFLAKKKVTSLDQLKGLKIRPIPGVSTKLVESWGAVPVGVRTPELYMALQKGQIDGLFTGPDNAVGMKLYEVLDYQVKIPTFSGAFVTIMNKKSWEKLPADIQKIIDEVSEETNKNRILFYEKLAKEAEATLSKNLEAYSLPPEEEAKWRQAASAVTENWIKEMEAKGYPARKAVEVMRSVVKNR